MKISFIRVHNFRKLQNCLIELSDTVTVFVGANNSGKTSAINAIEKFIGGTDYKIVFNDIFISHRKTINDIGEKWVQDDAQLPENLTEWDRMMPALDLCFWVDMHEFRHVSHIIPTLKWKGGELGVRLSLQPKKIEELFMAFKTTYHEARKTESVDEHYQGKIYPQNLCDFLKKNLEKYFIIKSYILDPDKLREEQYTNELFECDDNNPLKYLIKVHTIPAQRGFRDIGYNSDSDKDSLSAQLRKYYDKHLNPEKGTSPDDLKILDTMGNAAQVFDENLKQKFKKPLSELEALGYPGINDPEIVISTKVTPIESLKHDTAVQYRLEGEDKELMLPEQQNGLGYQNLISIVFTLMRYRDDWLRVGKAKSSDLPFVNKIEPIHLVLLEEPEAHLHVQVQQVFIQHAYSVLNKFTSEEDASNLQTQLLISTHSSHIAKETAFKNMRYFKRISSLNKVGMTKVVNLSEVFGSLSQTAKFVTRYLKSTHCDLFFADAVIAIEGTSEAILLPHFIKKQFTSLASRYISILNVSGKHIHRFENLLHKLALPTLIIADIDNGKATTGKSGKQVYQKVAGFKNDEQVSTNYSIYNWIMKVKPVDELLKKSSCEKVKSYTLSDKISSDYQLRIAYQTPITLSFKGKMHEVLPRTFEDSLIYSNWQFITDCPTKKDAQLDSKSIETSCELLSTETDHEDVALDSIGVFKKLKQIYTEATDIKDLHCKVFDYVNSQNFKASLALDIMYEFDPSEIILPKYIEEGFSWLSEQVKKGELNDK